MSESMDIIARFCRLQRNMRGELPIRSSEMGALIFVDRSEEPATPLAISQFFGIAKPSATAMVHSLLSKGYLSKSPSEVDNRSYTLHVTELGRQLLDQTQGDYRKSISMLEEGMGHQEFAEFIRLMRKANEILNGGK